MERLNDTEALVRQGINRPQLVTAGEGTKYFSEGEDASAAASGSQPGRFQRNVGAGSGSLAEAKQFLDGE